MSRMVSVIGQGGKEDLLSETQPQGELTAAGVVTNHTSRRSHDRSTGVVYPPVRFQTADGKTVEFQNGVARRLVCGCAHTSERYTNTTGPENEKPHIATRTQLS